MSSDVDHLFASVAGGSMSPITPETVAAALRDFRLRLAPGKDMAWLAMAAHRALAISVDDVDESPDRTSLAQVRSDLERLAELTSLAWVQLFERDRASDDRIWTVAWQRWDGQGGNESAEYRRFHSVLREMDWLASFLRKIARETPIPKGPWRNAERKRVRIMRAQYLAPIFEAAFGQRASGNNYPSGTHRSPTPFMDFYERMIVLAFGNGEAVNVSEVVKLGLKRHRQSPATFGALIPGLSGAE